jgi:hypothetical protein
MTGMINPGGKPPFTYDRGNRAELLFAEWAEQQGWQVTKRGWPDFICRRGTELMCVEVKDGSDHLSAYQEQTATDLAARGIPVFEWRPPNEWHPEHGQLHPVSQLQRIMTDEQVTVFTAADQAVRDLENACLLAEADCHRLTQQAAGQEAKLRTARAETAKLRADNDQLAADAGYLLRHILDCRAHYISTRIKTLTRRYRENLRTDIRPLPDGGIATVEPCGTGWPA